MIESLPPAMLRCVTIKINPNKIQRWNGKRHKLDIFSDKWDFVECVLTNYKQFILFFFFVFFLCLASVKSFFHVFCFLI